MRRNRKMIGFICSDEGVAGIVVAVLLLGLIVSAVGMVQGIFVPRWMEEKEAEHMEEVSNQFSQLKFAIDAQSALQEPNCPISTSITLGSKELPFLVSSRSYGSLKILPEEFRIIVNVLQVQDANSNVNPYVDVLGSIEYSSSNAYYIDQSYILENGALILSQDSGQIMSALPALSIVNGKDLSFNLVKFNVIGEKTAMSGYGTYPIKTRYYNTDYFTYCGVKNITIYTSHPVIWSKVFDDILSDLDIDYSIDNVDDGVGIVVIFDVDPSVTAIKCPSIFLKVTEIDVELTTR